jgi:hypothetical protein
MWLGAGHPLVQLLSRSETACQQLVTVTAAEAAGVVWYVGYWSFGLSLAIGAAVVPAWPATPLYGSELEPLRAELRRARYLMTRA